MSNPVFIYHFSSPTCGPCKVIKPAMETLREDILEDYPQVVWTSVNTHDDPHGYTSKFKITLVPTMIIVGGNLQPNTAARYTGADFRQYAALIRNVLRPPPN